MDRPNTNPNIAYAQGGGVAQREKEQIQQYYSNLCVTFKQLEVLIGYYISELLCVESVCPDLITPADPPFSNSYQSMREEITSFVQTQRRPPQAQPRPPVLARRIKEDKWRQQTQRQQQQPQYHQQRVQGQLGHSQLGNQQHQGHAQLQHQQHQQHQHQPRQQPQQIPQPVLHQPQPRGQQQPHPFVVTSLRSDMSSTASSTGPVVTQPTQFVGTLDTHNPVSSIDPGHRQQAPHHQPVPQLQSQFKCITRPTLPESDLHFEFQKTIRQPAHPPLNIAVEVPGYGEFEIPYKILKVAPRDRVEAVAIPFPVSQRTESHLVPWIVVSAPDDNAMGVGSTARPPSFLQFVVNKQYFLHVVGPAPTQNRIVNVNFGVGIVKRQTSTTNLMVSPMGADLDLPEYVGPQTSRSNSSSSSRSSGKADNDASGQGQGQMHWNGQYPQTSVHQTTDLPHMDYGPRVHLMNTVPPQAQSSLQTLANAATTNHN